MLSERRLSTSFSFCEGGVKYVISEDDLPNLPVDQLFLGCEELKKICAGLQAELDLYTRFVGRQEDVVETPSTTPQTPMRQTSLSSGADTPSASSADSRPLWQMGRTTRGPGKIKISEQEKVWLWENEAELISADRKKMQIKWEKEIEELEASTKALQKKAEDNEQILRQMKALTCHKPNRNNGKVAFSEAESFLQNIIRNRLRQITETQRKASLLKSDLALLRKRRCFGGTVLSDIAGGNSKTPSEATLLKVKMENEDLMVKVKSRNETLRETRSKIRDKRSLVNKASDCVESLERQTVECDSLCKSLEEEIEISKEKLSRMLRFQQLEDRKAESVSRELLKTSAKAMDVVEYLQLQEDVAALQKVTSYLKEKKKRRKFKRKIFLGGITSE